MKPASSAAMMRTTVMRHRAFAVATIAAALLAGLAQSDAATGDKAQTDEKAARIYPDTAPQPENEIRATVQITEVGLMRALLVLTTEAKDLEKLIAQRLTDVDFRVFPSAHIVASAPSAVEMRQIGQENKADLVLVADVKSREKSRFGEFQLNEGEATVQISSPVSGELLVSQTSRVSGVRHVDPVEAERSAREKALDMATREAIAKGLEKSHKLIVHTATITSVKDNNQLLIIKEHIAKMQGVYAVRQIAFDAKRQVAELEIIGSPKGEEFWRAWLERMPRARVTVTLRARPAQTARPANDMPAWFKTAR